MADGDSGKKASEVDIDAGYAFTRDDGPANNKDNAVNRWVSKHLVKPESPIYVRHPAEVKDGIRNNMAQISTAEDIDLYPLNLKNIAGWFFGAVVIRSFRVTRVLGRPRSGLPSR